MTFSANPAERLIAPPTPTSARERSRFGALLALCLLVHAALFAFLLRENALEASQQIVEQEIPVEVVVEPPPEELPEPPKPKQPPPKPQVQQEEYEKPAFDAPRAQNQETVERETPDKETAAPNVAPPKEQVAPEATQQKEANHAQEAAPEPSKSKEKQADDIPDAEIVEPAEPAPQTPQENNPSQAETKVPENQTQTHTIAEQIAALAPLPDFKLGSTAKHSPVSGGNAKTTYLSILYGMIVPRMRIPRSVRALHFASDGVVAFYIDERGNLTHQAVVRGSGVPDLDAAAIRAVRQAAPFPTPPLGHPRSILFHYHSR
jgi:protein TonB